MSPALAARVQARVSGRRSDGRSSFRPRVVLVARLAFVAAVVALLLGIFRVRRESRQALDEERHALLALLAAKEHGLTPEDRRLVAKVEGHLARAAAGYEGDFVADELRGPDAFRALLARSLVYARAELGGAPTPASVVHSASETVKDSFLLCLLEPPDARTEAALLRKVYVAYSSRARLEPATANARTFAEASAGVPFLSPAFTARVLGATDLQAVRYLKRTFERAPLDAAADALKARLLVLVVDEPSDHATPTELDGEKAHRVRVSVVDLTNERELLRLRKQVDPAWLSTQRRSDYARGLDGCALAVDVHEDVRIAAK
jgi:hypothetical protein